jgi:diguanylate cyclase (GGDEF)-like protein/PAS domain S-box-containing protein
MVAINRKLGKKSKIYHSKEQGRGEKVFFYSEEAWRGVFDSLQDAVIIFDKDCKIVMANEATLKFLDYKLEEIIGKRLVETDFFKNPESKTAATMGLMRILAGEQPESAVYEIVGIDGRTIMGEINSTPLIRNGKTIALICVVRDVTKRFQTERELKLANILLSTQQDTSLDGILAVNEEAKIISYNRRFLDIWGIPKDIMESRSNERALEFASNKVVNPEDTNAVVRHLYEHSNEKSHDEIFLKDGRVFDRYSAPMTDGEGRYHGRVWYFRDITQYRQAEDKIIQANAKLIATVNKLEEQNNHNRILSEMREMLQACSSLAEVPSVIRSSMGKLFPCASGALFMMSASRSDLESVIQWGDFPADLEDNIFAPDACWGLRRGCVHMVEKVSIGPLCPHVKHPPETAYVCLPLVAKGDVLGMLHLRGSQSISLELQEKMTWDLKELSATVSEYLSLSIANIKLGEKLAAQSIRDPLTGLFNRRYMEEILQREILRAERKNTPIGIVMADIDSFKRFNDTYGHAAGDELLARVGDFLKTTIRGADVACRYGGEEFILFLPESSGENTLQRIDKIREKIQSLDIRYHGEQLGPITFSFGIAIYPEHGTDAATLLKTVDAALYRAKQNGRNRIEIG